MGALNLNMNGHLRTPGHLRATGVDQMNQKTSCRLGHQLNQTTSWRLGHQLNQKTSWRLGHQVNQKTTRGLVIRIRFYRLL